MRSRSRLRYLLRDGSGQLRFGGRRITAAAMRYTEIGMTKWRTSAGRIWKGNRDWLSQLSDWHRNRFLRYCRPRFPNLLINGSSVLPVGMATNNSAAPT